MLFFSTNICTTKHEKFRLMLHAVSLNLPALLTAFTMYCLPQIVCCIRAIPSAFFNGLCRGVGFQKGHSLGGSNTASKLAVYVSKYVSKKCISRLAMPGGLHVGPCHAFLACNNAQDTVICLLYLLKLWQLI